MREMTFYGFLNEDGTVTHVYGGEVFTMPCNVFDWGGRRPPKEADYPNKEIKTVVKSILGGCKCGRTTILGICDKDLIAVDRYKRCFSLEC